MQHKSQITCVWWKAVITRKCITKHSLPSGIPACSKGLSKLKQLMSRKLRACFISADCICKSSFCASGELFSESLNFFHSHFQFPWSLYSVFLSFCCPSDFWDRWHVIRANVSSWRQLRQSWFLASSSQSRSLCSVQSSYRAHYRDSFIQTWHPWSPLHDGSQD